MEADLQTIKKVIQVANSNIEFEERLQGILDILTNRPGVHQGGFFLLSPNRETLDLKNVSPREVFPGTWSSPLARHPLYEGIKDRRPFLVSRLNRREHKGLLKNPFFRGFGSLAAWPVEDDNTLYGVLCLLSREAREIQGHEQELLEMAGRELAGVIRNSRIYTEAKKRIAELSVLYQVGRVIGSTLELDELLQKTVSTTAQVINAKGSALTIVSGLDDQVMVNVVFGLVPPFHPGDPVKGCPGKQRRLYRPVGFARTDVLPVLRGGFRGLAGKRRGFHVYAPDLQRTLSGAVVRLRPGDGFAHGTGNPV